MKRMLLCKFTGIFSIVCMLNTHAQTLTSDYDPGVLFSPLFYPEGGTITRSSNGSPNVGYWQNRADYQLTAVLDDQKNEIKGTVIITYKNNSPHRLAYLWLQLDQNLYTKDSRGQLRMPLDVESRYGEAASVFEGGFKISKVQLLNSLSTVDYTVTDTRMQVMLPKPMEPAGDVVRLKIDYSFLVPVYGSDRLGILKTGNGDIYAIAQWYPRMCVFDDIEGWNTLPYLGAGEFYLEYGDFDCTITAPASHLVVAGGTLLNANEVLSPTEIQRLEQAKHSDKTVVIRTAAEVSETKNTPPAKVRCWHFKLNNARDFSWASSSSFIWDAAKINLPAGKTSLAMSVYPVESAGETKWSRATEYIKGSVENYSKHWMTYPYPVAVNVATNISGMEYPGIVFCSAKSEGKELFDVSDHEFGHTWFPMIVGSNERKFGWMDEGFNTFINSISDDEFNNGEYKKPPINMRGAAPYYFGSGSERVMTGADALKEKNISGALYFRPGYALELLRNDVLGPQRFDYAFKTYIKNWAYRHPTPWDFFRTMENAAGEDLGWFWKEWFFENYKLDQSIVSVKYIQDSVTNGAVVTIANLGQMAMPVILSYETRTGTKGTIKLPVEIWNNTQVWKVKLPTTEELKAVVLDPDKHYPDMNFDNNTWKN